MATKLQISELDFDGIKSNLKNFLSQQDEFRDYDFEGSGMSVLLDLMAYNTHYLGYNANMLANEMFLDSADLRASVVSKAKQVGYTPTSSTSADAVVDVVVNDATGSSLTMTRGTKFTTTVNSISYSFVNNAELSITPSDGVYKFSNVSLNEGTLLNFKYTANSSDTDEIYFGDGVLGKSIADGNIIIMDYIVCNRGAPNGATTFTLSGTLGGFSDATVTTISNATNGSGPESIESIKYNAPRDYTSQDRAVTADDYKVLVKSLYANAQSVQVYGGEDAATPEYGKVFISIKAKSGSNLTESTKASIVTSLKQYAVASIRPTIIDPEITYLTLNTNFKYDSTATTKGASTLETNVLNTITNYGANTLENFTGVFRHSKLLENINNADTSILSNITTVKMYKTITPTLSSALKYTVSFNNAFYNPHSGHNASGGGVVSSTGFKINDDSSTNEHFLDDDGAGNLRVYYLSGTTRIYTDSTFGTVNYSTGEVVLTSANITSISNIDGAASTLFRVFAIPNSNDIVPVRNQVLEIDTANSTVSADIDTVESGSSQAGTTYTTTSSYSSY
jgi:hypothetical protein